MHIFINFNLGVGIWCMHFIGMSAITIYDDNHDVIPFQFRIDLTIVSLIAVIVFTLFGFWIGTIDRAFVVDKLDYVDSFIEQMRQMPIQDIRKMKHRNFVIGSALFRNMRPLLLGGILIASGVCIMHYVGMLAIVFEGTMRWNPGIVAASCLIALVAATAALWIMFRLLAMFPNLELLRFICAVIMAIAVSGMHYTGMQAAEFSFHPASRDNSQYLLVTIDDAVRGAIIGAILFISFIFIIAVADLRVWHFNLSRTFYELDTLLEPALLEESRDKRTAFLEAYIRFRGDNATDRAVREFRFISRNISKKSLEQMSRRNPASRRRRGASGEGSSSGGGNMLRQLHEEERHLDSPKNDEITPLEDFDESEVRPPMVA